MKLLVGIMKPDLSAYPGVIQPFPIPERIWKEISMDFIKKLPTSHGKSSQLAQVFLDQVYKLHGLPESIVSDGDKVFLSNFWKALFAELKVKLDLSTAYHPQTDGQTELINRSLGCYLRCMVGEKPKEWVKWLPLTEFWCNINYHTSTKTTPYEVVYCQTPPIHVLYIPGESRVEEVDMTLHAREEAIKKMIPEPGDANRDITVTETFHLQTDDELSDKELKQIEADDQAIQTILLGLPKDIYVVVDSCETAQEIWLRVQQIMKGSDIGIQEKKAKLFNEWERFTFNEGESIESYYHRFLKLINDLKRNKHFPEKIASNLKFLNNLHPEWSRHVTIVHQTKDLHTADYTQLYDFLKYNQKEVDELKAERLAKIQDPLALMANSNNPY
nr:reverse transcriptase [Tanacetum cinerariifolium]